LRRAVNGAALMCVRTAAAASFLTPVATPAIMMDMNPAGDRLPL